MEAAHLPSGTSKGNNNVVNNINIKILIIPDYIDGNPQWHFWITLSLLSWNLEEVLIFDKEKN